VRFRPGDVVVRREVLHGRTWMESPVTAVADDGDVLAVLLQPGACFTFHPHPFGPHPWAPYDAWSGPTVLQLHREGDAYAVWKFFDEGVFRYWYVNFEAPVVRRDGGFDTDDHGLDLIVRSDGRSEWKDVEHLSEMVRSRRMTGEGAVDVLHAAAEVTRLLRADERWWSPWDDWSPPKG
jgi:hypothetical protein